MVAHKIVVDCFNVVCLHLACLVKLLCAFSLFALVLKLLQIMRTKVKYFFGIIFSRREKGKNMNDFLRVVIAFNGGNERGSYTNLANKLNIARSQVSDWISGRRKPTEAQAKAMSKLFLESKDVQATGVSVTLRSIKMMFGMKDALLPVSEFGVVYLPLLAALPAGPADYYEGEKIK